MDLFLLRHGAAESFAERDRDRALTAEGREQLNRVLQGSQEDLRDVSLVSASPFLRTQQTCNIALQYLPQIERGPNVLTSDILVPSSNPSQVLHWLSEQTAHAVLLITHQPLIGTLLNELCAFEPGRYRMGTGALAHVHLDVMSLGAGELRWLRQE